MSKTRVVLGVLVTGCLSMGASQCMTAAEKDAMMAALDLDSASSHSSTEAPAPACFQEKYVQPEAQISRSIDLLFVMDTSGSMSDNRAKAAEGISAFVAELPGEVDYRVAVMLSQGKKGTWSGKLFSYNGVTVFDSKKMSVDSIRTQLKNMVLHTPTDTNGEQSEESFYSLLKGLTTNLDLNRQKGFFRTDAALAVVFVSDENDICAPYVDNPSMPGLTSTEKTIRNRDCPNGIATDAVISQVKAIQGARPYLFGAVIHKQLGYKDSAGNDGFGWGYSELIQASAGVSTEINDGSYTEGLSAMGKLATIKLNLVLDYSLTRSDIDPASVTAFVDGLTVPFTFDAAMNEIHLSQGGDALSQVVINYCQKVVQPANPTTDPSTDPGTNPGTNPSPTPSPSPAPDPDPNSCDGFDCGVLGI